MRNSCRSTASCVGRFCLLLSFFVFHCLPREALAWLLDSPSTRIGRYRKEFTVNLVRRQLYLFDYNDKNSTAFVNTPPKIIEKNDERNENSGIPSYTGTFGDIMSPKSNDADVLFRDGLVTTSSYSLAEMYGIHNPMDRIAVTANGNLQRLFSSYYDAPVNVVVEHCHQTIEKSGEWDRRVHLAVFDTTFCTADSRIVVHNPECRELVESGKVGLGQLFRYQNVLPEFILQDAGPTAEGGFWRNYTLDCPLMTCHIHEVFIPNVWNLKATAT